MTAPNGRANGSAIDNPSEQVVQTLVPPTPMRSPTAPLFSSDEIKHLIAELEVPFDPAVIEWRVTNTTSTRTLLALRLYESSPRIFCSPSPF
jgi:hypothetical protein